jgi:hypothetical protein
MRGVNAVSALLNSIFNLTSPLWSGRSPARAGERFSSRSCSFCTTAGPRVYAVLFHDCADMMHLRNGRRSRPTFIHEEQFMGRLKAIAAVLLMTVAGAAHAQFSGTVTAVSDYDFRGVSLSATDPALQASLDWAHDSGLYLGIWGSNIDYVGLSYKMVEFKQWYTNDYAGTDIDGLYSEVNLTFELPAGFGLGLHAGYNYGDIFEDTEYMDYSVGVTYTLGHFDLELKYVDNDLSDDDPLFTEDDVFNTEGRAILSVSTTFPWSSE